IADALSVSIFIQELGLFYDARDRGETALLPELPIQYADYSTWQREWLQSGALQRQITYWNRQLDGVPAILDLPTDKPRPPFLSYSGATESFSLPAKLSESLKSLCRQERVTLFMGLLGVFQVLLHRYSGQADFIVSSGVANRNHSFLEPLI